MKKIIAISILLSLWFSSVNAVDVESSASNTVAQQASADQYKKILSDKVEESFAEKIKKYFISSPVVTDYSYRYQKKSIQVRALSCEISAAADILARHTDKRVTEDYLLDQIGKSYYNELPREIDGKTIWWNPNIGFVWNIDLLSDWEKASQWKMTWYWVLEKPIAELYEQFGLKTKIITEKSHRPEYDRYDHLTQLIQELENGSSVQLWGDYCTTPEFEDTENINKCYSLNDDRTRTWYYKDINGDLVKHVWLAGEHAFILLGYTGSKYNPKSVIVWDTNTGKHTYDIKEWMRKWEMMQYRSIIIYAND